MDPLRALSAAFITEVDVFVPIRLMFVPKSASSLFQGAIAEQL